jgi:hypothetical protein
MKAYKGTYNGNDNHRRISSIAIVN